MVFFLDRNMPPGLVRLFQALGYEAIHHNTLFGSTTGDPEILQYVALNNYVLVTYDVAMVKAHSWAYKKYGTMVVFLIGPLCQMKIAGQKDWYNSNWDSIGTLLNHLCIQYPGGYQVKIGSSVKDDKIEIELLF